MRQFAKPMDFLIDTFNQLTGKSIPSLSDALDKLDEVVIDFGEVVDENMGRSRLEVDALTESVKEADDAIATIGNSTIPKILMPQMEKMGKTVDDSLSPYLEYGKRLEKMGRPMENLALEAKALSEEFGITMSDAIDHIARVKMRELDQEFNEFMTNLLEKKQAVMAGSVHTAPTDFGVGGGGLPAGLQGQGALSVGLEALAAGLNPTVVVQTYLDGLVVAENAANRVLNEEDVPPA